MDPGIRGVVALGPQYIPPYSDAFFDPKAGRTGPLLILARTAEEDDLGPLFAKYLREAVEEAGAAVQTELVAAPADWSGPAGDGALGRAVEWIAAQIARTTAARPE